MFPWELVDGLWVTKSGRVALSVRVISFRDFYACGPHPPTSQTDWQTDGRTDGRTDDMQSQYRAVHNSASRGKNSKILDCSPMVCCSTSPSLWIWKNDEM